MTAEFTPGISSENGAGQRENGGPGRIDAHEPTFYEVSDALSYAHAFSTMEDP